VKQEIFDRLIEFQKDAQSILMPQFLKDGPSLGQRERRGVVMDANWWLWNIAMACTPGLLITLVCQYYKSDMEEFYKKQQLLEGKEENGSRVEEGEKNNPSSKADSMWTLESWSAISEVFSSQQKQEKNQDDDDLDGQIVHEGDKSNLQKVASIQKNHTENTDGDNISIPIPPQTAQSEPNAQDLMTRIEALENQIQEFKEQNNKTPESTTSRRSGSNIQKRMHGDRQRTKQDQNEPHNDNNTAERSSLDMLLSFATTNLHDKGEAVVNAGQELRRKLEDQCGITPILKEGDSLAEDTPQDESAGLVVVSTEPLSFTEQSSHQVVVSRRQDSLIEPDTQIDAKEDATNSTKNKWFHRLHFLGNRNKNDK